MVLISYFYAGNMNEDHAKASDMWAMGTYYTILNFHGTRPFNVILIHTGVLLYCFVCGCLPFENSGILDLHNSIVNDS